MTVDPKELASRLGIEHKYVESFPATDAVEVTYFKVGDPVYTLRARDGGQVPRGIPVEELRVMLAKSDGEFNGHLIQIPEKIQDRTGWYANVAFTNRRTGP